MRFSVCSICRSKSGISRKAPDSRVSAWYVSIIDTTPPSSRSSTSRRESWRRPTVRRAISRLEIERAELEVGDGHVGDEVAQDDVAGFLAREQLGAGRLRRPPPPAPEVELEREVDAALREERVLQGERAAVGRPRWPAKGAWAVPSMTGNWNERVIDDLGLGVQDARRGDAGGRSSRPARSGSAPGGSRPGRSSTTRGRRATPARPAPWDRARGTATAAAPPAGGSRARRCSAARTSASVSASRSRASHGCSSRSAGAAGSCAAILAPGPSPACGAAPAAPRRRSCPG